MKQRIAIIGLGMALKPHLSALRGLSDRVEIAAAWSPNAGRREETAARLGLPAAASLDAILADRSIGAALVLSPPLAHLDLVRRCAEAGKHVLMEKPLDVSVARATESVEAMERAGRCFGIVFQHRFRPASLALKTLVEAGALGRLVSASASIRWWRTAEYYKEPGRGMLARDGGGVLLTQAIHTLDLFLSLAGAVRTVRALAANAGLRDTDTEDVAAAAIRFESGAVGAIDATTTAFPGFPERIELAGSEATAVLAAESLEVFHRDGRVERIEGGESRSGGADPMAFSDAAHKALIADFLDAVEQGRAPTVDGRAALRVQTLIEDMLASAKEAPA